jgi:hypothetical protein
MDEPHPVPQFMQFVATRLHAKRSARHTAGMVSNPATSTAKFMQTLNRLRQAIVARFQNRSTFWGRAWARLTDWLADVTWKRLFVVAILLLIVGGLFSGAVEELFYKDHTVVQIAEQSSTRKDTGKKTKITITADEQGVRVNTEPAQGGAAVPTPPALPTPPAVPGAKPEEAPREPRVLSERKGVQIIVDAKEGLSEDVQEVLDEVKTNIKDSLDQEEPTAKTIVKSAKPSAGSVIMNLVSMLVFGMVALKVIMNTQRKAQAKVAVAQEATEQEALKRQLTEARLTTLQAQVEPHFLFNTLASVEHLIEVDPARASQMQKSLIQYLRAAMPHMRETSSTMGREAQLARSYLEILKFRMEERLEFSVNVPAGLASAEVPPMMLLSLVENAIKHGLEPKPAGGRVDVQAEIMHGKLHVTVADTGLGYNPGKSTTRGTGVGLANIHERLAMLYSGKAQLTVTYNTPTGTLCTLELPYRVAKDTAA